MDIWFYLTLLALVTLTLLPVIMNRNIRVIFRRELSSFFTSPLAYVLIFIFLVIINAVTFQWPGRELIESEQAALKDFFFFYHPWVLAFYAPLLAMRSISDEHRQGTLELISTMPVRTIELVMGKFLGAFIVLIVSLLLTLSVVVTVSLLGNPDPGPIWTGYIGSILVGGVFIAVSIAISALTRSQVICVAVAIPVCLVLCIIGFDPALRLVNDGGAPAWATEGLSSLSVIPPFMDFAKGLIDLRYLFYFLSVIALCIFATNSILQSKRA